MKPPPSLRRLTALVPAVLMILASLSLAPTASADTYDIDTSWSLEIKIHENETVDVAQVIRSENSDLTWDCDVSNFEENFGIDDDIKTSAKNGDSGKSCTFTAEGMTLKQFNNGYFNSRISHHDGSFTFEMGHFNDLEQVTIEVTFPGSVSEISGHGEKSGNTATWNNAQNETNNLVAEGTDHASSRDSEDNDTNSFLPIIIIIVLVLATIGGVAIFIIIRQKRAKTGIAPGYPQPGQQPYNPQQPYNSQPGYGQPGQAPGTAAAQPGYYTQPGAQQSHSPQSDYDQPGQQPRSPDGQY